ncbi:uncharacterized protein METZ01_LOCUS325470, partial [marine metagenome]
MTRKIVWAYVSFAVSFVWISGQVFAESQITTDLKGTIDQVLEIVADQSLKSDP